MNTLNQINGGNDGNLFSKNLYNNQYIAFNEYKKLINNIVNNLFSKKKQKVFKHQK